MEVRLRWLDPPENGRVPYGRARRGVGGRHSTRGENGLSTRRRTLHKGRVVDLGMESLTLPDGSALELEVVRHPGGAAAVAVDAEGKVCLLRQFRHAGGGWLWEVPAGKLDPGEDSLTTARRELEEEAGVRAGEWLALGTVLPTPGFCDERIHLFLARELVYVEASPGAHELLEVHWLPLTEAVSRALDGQITDAKTVVALVRAEALLRESGAMR